MALPLSERCLPDYISAGTYERVVEEVPDPILAMYLQALSGALWKNSTIPLWKNATPPKNLAQDGKLFGRRSSQAPKDPRNVDRFLQKNSMQRISKPHC
ncbi:hypothetical protein Y032_0017g3415 [Ancylostoma ceylanicum]|uniref:Uncharacterized protein n=1 Tax=Ancylostoma ceylanicum TaxID=53326 RepID=A0A016V781_9BILA|nr:hypothetical protein Y032_0017g3415 [Ancylostoma ceylanicum]